MKKLWLQKEDCTGCGLCENVCPQNAITMEKDECGFSYPRIHSNCVDCNLCEKKCRGRLCLEKNNLLEPATYASWSKDEAIRFNSTSGGAFSELVSPILQGGGYVVGAEYAADNTVHHTVIHTVDDLEKIRQSKYVQSSAGLIYKQVKNLLANGETVAFCGAPCQIAALYAYLGKRYEKLYTIDFICRGMNSPKAYLSWLAEIEKKEKKKIVKVWFKYKDGGWKASPRCTRLDYSDGTNTVLRKNENLFMSGYLSSNLYIRPCCGNCQFKGVPRNADVTLADFWGIESHLDDDKGTSLVLINNDHGKELLEQSVERLQIYERSFSEIFAGNVCFSSSVEVPAEGVKFLRSLSWLSFSKALAKCSTENRKHSIGGRAIRKIRRVIMGIVK